MLAKTKKNRRWLAFLIVFVIGLVITIAEPDLQVLASQLNSKALIYIVAGGVGLFLAVSVMRIFFRWKLRILLFAFYGLVFAGAVVLQFVNPDFLAAAFDSGGVTTGPITVPFLLAFGIGISTVRSSKNAEDDSFGTVALCSVGPILAVIIMGLTKTVSIGGSEAAAAPESAGAVFTAFGQGFLHNLGNVAIAVGPILAVFFLFQLINLRLPKSQIIRIIIGILYTYVGLTVFLTGVEVGFLPLGSLLGAQLASLEFNWILIPIGVAMGALIVLAEPAIHVLNKQVEEVTGGAISKKVMLVSLCIGVSAAVGLSMLRVVTGISIWWFLVPVYAVSLVLMFFVAPMFTGIAFDSGGVASGPMTATFLLPFAVGAAADGRVFTDAFGLVAFVAMAPLITIQAVGLIFKLKTKRLSQSSLDQVLLLGAKELSETFGETVDFDVPSAPIDFDLASVVTLEDGDEPDDIGKTVDFD
jgi:hypothetical protein